MTNQTKNYIELSDILAIHCACKRCGGSVSVPLNASEFRTDGLYACPNCKEEWTVFGQGRLQASFDKEIHQFVSTLKLLSQTLKTVYDGRGDRGLALYLEVRNSKEANESSSRAGA